MLSGSSSRASAGTGPAKWAAVVVLSSGLGAGVTYWLTRGTEQPPPGRPVQVELPAIESPGRRVTLPPRVHKPDDHPEAAAVAPGAAEGQPAAGTGAQPPSGETPSLAARRLDLNAATQAELELLPGIGPATAKAIVDFRTQSGGFRSIDDLDKVPGIGPKTVERVKPYLRLGPG